MGALAPPAASAAPPPALDGGYGWAIVGGAWLCFFWVFGLFYSFGVLLGTFLDEFGESRGVTSLLQV
jgi:ABC-type phosphate transport system permease subunit